MEQRFHRRRSRVRRFVRVTNWSRPRQPLLALLLALLGLSASLGVWAAPPDPDFDPHTLPARSPSPLLPDLRTVPPDDLTVEFGRGGRRLLRLANMVWNSGEGALELA